MTDQPLDAVVVGAGFGGIGAAIALRKLGYDNFVVLEREDDLGGTWHVNRYPGLAVDIPSTTYSYWFEPNPNWSRLFAPGAELKRYADDVADKYDVRRHMRFSTSVESARWDSDSETWHVATADGRTLTTRFLITATGFLSQPHTPDIPGITEFDGRLIHTTDWDDGYDFTDRRIGLIGTGATAVQLIPKLAERVADMTVYQRTPIYVVPKFDFPIAAPLRALFGRVPFAHRAFRWVTDNILELMMVSAVLHYRQFRLLNSGAAVLAKAHLYRSIRDPELRRKLTPDYDFGCKRPTFSNTFFRAFTKPNVHLETTSIEHIVPDGIVTTDGRKTAIDTLVLATGHLCGGDADAPALDWAQLARPRQTVVFYMGVAALPQICAQLIHHGLPPDTPAAVVEQATLPAQRTIVGTVQTLPTLALVHQVSAPALIFIGGVVALHEQLAPTGARTAPA